MHSRVLETCLALCLWGFLITTPVFAEDTTSTPNKQEQKESTEKSLRVKYEIMIASHAFDQIEKVAKDMGEQYLAGKLTGAKAKPFTPWLAVLPLLVHARFRVPAAASVLVAIAREPPPPVPLMAFRVEPSRVSGAVGVSVRPESFAE